MKRFFLVAAAAFVAASVVVIACSKDENDKDKGIADGKALCTCMLAAKTEAAMEACESKLDQSKIVETDDPSKYNEYMKGVTEGVTAGGCGGN
jgi:hypothetical protein